MSYSMSDYFANLVLDNVSWQQLFGAPWAQTYTLPDGHQIASAVNGHPETITYWLPDAASAYHQITHDQAFVQKLWVDFALGGNSNPETQNGILSTLGLLGDYHITQAAMKAAVLSMPNPNVMATIVEHGYTEAQVWAYAQYEAPHITLVGQTG